MAKPGVPGFRRAFARANRRYPRATAGGNNWTAKVRDPRTLWNFVEVQISVFLAPQSTLGLNSAALSFCFVSLCPILLIWNSFLRRCILLQNSFEVGELLAFVGHGVETRTAGDGAVLRVRWTAAPAAPGKGGFILAAIGSGGLF